ncbi:hypothetical protein ACTHGU_03655 [Chitinophagaceae bacterium MMS25-I14]
MKSIITCILICICCNAFAVGPVRNANASADKTLTGLFEALKNEDNYGYDLTVISRLEGSDSRRDTVHISNYQSRRSFLFYTQSAGALFFVSRHGQFRVNTGDKTIYYQQYNSDSIAGAVLDAFRSPQMLGMLDSLFLAEATVASQKRDKGQLVYVLKYPEHSSVKEMKMVYNTTDSLFRSIEYVFERPAPDRQSKILQQVQMNHYTRKAPAEVQLLEEKSKDLKTYLSITYKGYTIKTI